MGMCEATLVTVVPTLLPPWHVAQVAPTRLGLPALWHAEQLVRPWIVTMLV